MKLAIGLLLILVAAVPGEAQVPDDGTFRWRVGQPLLSVDATKLPKSEAEWIAVKDPSIVRFEKKWHLFCTLRKNKTGEGRIRIGYLSFADWEEAKLSQWNVLDLTPGYHGAPQIFWFKPHRKWYLIYQAEDQARGLKYGPCYSTNDDITKPGNWTKPKPLYVVPDGKNAGLDFWVICDSDKAHLFFTSLNGRMWRAETALGSFPSAGWSKPKVALRADIFEASHTYRLAGENRFLTVVEAIGNRRRYFKGFVADSLDGEWKPLAGSPKKPLVSPINVVNQNESWATSYSHGEFLRVGFDESLTIDPNNLQLLFQGADDKAYRDRKYGQVPWQLGLLSQISSDE
ncbi:MAG: non-reducing end alpha-L-arabinofuranosidase family hydrolase [Planctomycetaceae bacterium]